MSRHRYLSVTLLTALIGLFSLASLSSVSAVAPTLSKAYSTKGSIGAGSIVRLLPGATNTVAVANTANPSGLIGVSEASSGSLIAINPSSNTVQVAVSGTAETLVSTINGNIKQGSYVAVSPFGGMGMAASPEDHVIGIAANSFSNKSAGAKEQTITSTAGSSTSVWTGEIPVSIAVGIDNTNSANAKLNSLQQLAHSITGHVISTGRVIAALVLAVLAFATLVTLTYSITYSSIISIGRNPLARVDILKDVAYVVAALVVIALVAALLIYLLLS